MAVRRILLALALLAAGVSCAADLAWVRVAAANSTDEAKAAADFVCPGSNDETVVQKALDVCRTNDKGVFLFNGTYNFDAFRDFGDGGPKAAVVFPNLHRDLVVRGQSFRNDGGSRLLHNGVTIRLRAGAWATAGGASADVLRGAWTERGIQNGSSLRLENLAVFVPDARHPVRCVDLRRVDRVDVRSLRLHALGDRVFAGQHYPFANPPLEVPIEESIGLTMTDGSNYNYSHYTFVGATGFGQGIQVGGEHVVMDTCAATFGLYGFTFGNYPYSCGFNHPITLVNCCDEQNVNLPLFNSCGDKGGAIHGRQEVTMISFNCERVAAYAPGGKLGRLMRETRPGTWRGNISFTRQPRWNDINSVDEPIWEEDGSGSGFVTRNNAHRTVCGSAERRSYYPQLGQQVFDTDLNKLLICVDPKSRKWVDALGNAVP